jgi:hypothetical protein
MCPQSKLDAYMSLAGQEVRVQPLHCLPRMLFTHELNKLSRKTSTSKFSQGQIS